MPGALTAVPRAVDVTQPTAYTCTLRREEAAGLCCLCEGLPAPQQCHRLGHTVSSPPGQL